MATTRKVSRKTSSKKSKKPVVETTVETPVSQSVEHYIADPRTAGSNGNGANGAHDHSNAEPAFEEIQRRAYELFVARGYAHGDDMGDWFTAESELRNGPSHAD